jgi:hypothetical protein
MVPRPERPAGSFLTAWRRIAMPIFDMPIFEDSEKAAERQYEQERELTCRIVARRNKLLGVWAADHMGLIGEDAARYAQSIVEAELTERDDEAIVKTVCDDLVARGFPIVERDVREQLQVFSAKARTEVAASCRR